MLNVRRTTSYSHTHKTFLLGKVVVAEKWIMLLRMYSCEIYMQVLCSFIWFKLLSEWFEFHVQGCMTWYDQLVTSNAIWISKQTYDVCITLVYSNSLKDRNNWFLVKIVVFIMSARISSCGATSRSTRLLPCQKLGGLGRVAFQLNSIFELFISQFNFVV